MNNTRWSAVRSVLPLIALLAAACSGGDASGPKVGPPATISVVSGSAQTAQAGQPLGSPLVVKVADAAGLGVSKLIVTFTITTGGGTLSQSIDTTDANGQASANWTVGSTLGEGRVEARAQGLVAPAAFTATIGAGPAALLSRISDPVGNSAAGFVTGDSVAVKVTDQFNNVIANAPVTFAVTAGGGQVSAATKNTDDNGVARTAWTMGTSGSQTLRATSGSLTADITATATSCNEVTLSVADVLTLDPNSAACVILNGTGKNYLITVVNPTNSPTAYAAYRGRGAAGALSTEVSEAPVTAAPRQATLRTLPVSTGEDVRDAIAQQRAHLGILQQNMQLMERMGPSARSGAIRTNKIMAQVAPPTVGDMIDMKIPNINSLCTGAPQNVRARVLYVGTRGIMLEDSANTLAGQLDTLYAAIGKEFDDVMFPILQNNFGNPLAMDAQLNNDGHIYMLFSTRINTIGNGNIAGFVSSADFFPTSSCPASNVGEVFYARAPTSTASGFNGATADAWRRSTRSVIQHETKHITSFAEKYSRGGNLSNFSKDQWLEESSAMLAEELWGRGIFGYAPKSNVNYTTSIFCEVRPTPSANWPQCQPAKPLNIFDHFIYLYDYASDPENLSIVGPVSADDGTFYGAGWMFLRWVIDTYATSESAFLKAMNTDITNAGIDNIAARTGKTFQQLLSEFSIAFATDDLTGFTPKDPKYAIASWNVPNIFAGMSADFSSQNFFTNPTPLKLRPGAFGTFTIDVGSVHGGGFSVMQLKGTQANKQLLELKGPAGTAFPSEMRVNIVRVQ